MAIPTKDDLEAAPEALLQGAYCSKPEDFFSPPARDLIGRFLANFTESLVITPAELVFSAKYQKRLNDAGRVMMNAVDKIATLQAKVRGAGAAQRLRELNDLISAGMKKVWDDDKDRPPAAVTPETFSAYCAGLKGAAFEREYAACRALTEYLSGHKVWKDKVTALVQFFLATKGKDENRWIEQILAECLRSDPALDQMLGLCETLEERCNDLADLWKGDWSPRASSHPIMETLATLIKDGSAPNCKASVEYALLRTMAGKLPLRSAEPEVEIQALFDLFRKMWLGNTLIGGGKALMSLERRQARHLNKEGITDLLRDRKVLADRYALLMQLSTVAVGQGNRATIKTFIDHYFGDKDFAPRVASGQEPPVPKLQTLTGLHRAIMNSWLGDEEKAAYGTQVEAAQTLILKNTRLFEQIDKKGGGPSQKVLALLDLCRKGTFIEGSNMETVRKMLTVYLRDGAFLPDYLGNAQGEERERKMTLLTKTLAGIGITA